jgi:TolB-like protein/DNA-binding winged helix-turn-helix (wHTH) protein/Flp pilus assembly protein TadD
MLQPQETHCQVSFGPFTVDIRSAELKKNGVRVKIQDRSFEILTILLERPGEVVTRDELRNRLWPEGTFVDFDNNINASMGKLRGALSDSAATPRYIETVGRGYRFIADVRQVLETFEAPTLVPQAAAPGEPAQVSALSTVRKSPPRSRRIWTPFAAVALLTLAGFLVYSLLSRTRSRPPSGKMMLAVLPFANLTGDAAQEYFSDGLTEEMIAQLGRLDPQHLGVIARTSVMPYKNSQKQVDAIARELSVEYVLEGSVRREPGKVRITAQLIQASDQTHIWSQEYDRELSSLLAIQGDIARQIAEEIQLAFDRQARSASSNVVLSPRRYEAYDLYLRGQYFLNKRTIPAFQQAIEAFQQSTAKYPDDARAYAGLANSYMLLNAYSLSHESDYASKARVAAMRALQLDDNLPEAHTALALVVQNYDWNWHVAEKEFRRAIELDPNYATAHHWYAEHLTWRGRFDEALRESEQARKLDPLSLIIAADRGAILYYSRQYDRAIQQLQSVLALEPNFPRAHLIASVYAEKGMLREALVDIEKQRPNVEPPWYWSTLAYVYGRCGRPAEARQALYELNKIGAHTRIDPAVFLFAYAGTGDKEQLLATLDAAYAQHSSAITTLKVAPAYDVVRNEPRFQDLLRRLGF